MRLCPLNRRAFCWASKRNKAWTCLGLPQSQERERHYYAIVASQGGEDLSLKGTTRRLAHSSRWRPASGVPGYGSVYTVFNQRQSNGRMGRWDTLSVIPHIERVSRSRRLLTSQFGFFWLVSNNYLMLTSIDTLLKSRRSPNPDLGQRAARRLPRLAARTATWVLLHVCAHPSRLDCLCAAPNPTALTDNHTDV